MRLFVLHFAGKDLDRLAYLRSAARKLKVELLPIDVSTYDFSKKKVDLTAPVDQLATSLFPVTNKARCSSSR